MSASSSFNLFLLLELDPDAPWSEDRFEQRMGEKVGEWSRQQTHPKKGPAAKENLEKTPKLREVAWNEAERAKHAVDAKRLRETEHEENLNKLRGELDLLQPRGYLLSAELDDLLKRHGGVLTESEIRAELKVPVRKAEASKARKQETLDPSLGNAVSNKLTELGRQTGEPKEDLYEFLELRREAATTDLREKAVAVYQQANRRAVKDSKLTLTQELATFGMEFFENDSNRAKYDAWLDEAKFDELRRRLEFIGKHSDISAEQIRQLAEKYGSADRNRTDAVIRDHIREKRLGVEPGALGQIKSLQRCGYDGALNSPDALTCETCGEPLKEPCPGCGKPVSTDQGACDKCGFPAGNRVLVKVLCGEADEALGKRDYTRANELIGNASRAWPQGARGKLADRIKALEAKGQSALAKQSKVLEQLRRAVKERRLYEAESLLAQSRPLFSSTSVELSTIERDVTRGIAETRAKLAEARKGAGNDPDARFEVYQGALAICADCREALDGLAQLPPPPPTALKVTPAPSGFRLAWQPVQSRGRISYRVVGNRERPPRDATDGMLVVETEEVALTDSEAPVGLPWYYAVFSLRAGVASSGAARSGPYLRTAEVTSLRAEPGAGSVTLNWEPPANCLAIVARRREGAVPSDNRDGKVLDCGERALHDTGLTDGRTYGYRISVQFADPAQPGGRITTAGIGITACPQLPPPAIEDLAQRRDGNTVMLTWTSPADVQVQLRRGPYPPPFEPGRIIALDQVDRLGEALPIHHPGRTQLTLQGSGSFQITPLTVRGRLAVVGRGERITNIDEVIAPNCRVAGRSILLTWGWPAGVESVRVCYRTDRPPRTPDELGAIAVDVPRARYDREGGCRVQADDTKPHYFRLFAKAPNGDAWSGGVDTAALFGQGPLVQQEARIQRNWLRKVLAVDLVLRSQNVTELRDIVVVSRGQIPLDRNNGELAGCWANVQLVDGEALLSIPSAHWGNDRYARAFLLDAGQGIQLRHGGKEQMRLG